jgi:tetratricopeptide (TPR) repeat protein
MLRHFFIKATKQSDEQGLKLHSRSATIGVMAVETGKRDEKANTSGLPNAEFIERCQLEYERNPSSRVFAPLAEAYRRLDLIDEAFEIASRGVRLHPDFAAGRIAYARVLIAKKAYADAVDQLQRSAELSPDNILAFLLLGETLLELRRPKDALNAFKMVLFLNPIHERARKMVQRWEFLTADEFEDENFEWSHDEAPPLEEQETKTALRVRNDPSRADREAHRAISIADALTVRNDIEGAFAQIGRSIRALGPRPDLEHRLMLLGKRMGLRPEEIQRLATDGTDRHSTPRDPVQLKKEKIKKLLKKVNRSKVADSTNSSD